MVPWLMPRNGWLSRDGKAGRELIYPTSAITTQREPGVCDETGKPKQRSEVISMKGRPPGDKTKKGRGKTHLRRRPSPSKRKFMSDQLAKTQHQPIDKRHDEIDRPTPYNHPDRRYLRCRRQRPGRRAPRCSTVVVVVVFPINVIVIINFVFGCPVYIIFRVCFRVRGDGELGVVEWNVRD